MKTSNIYNFQWFIGVIIGIALFAGLFSLFVSDRHGTKGSGLSQDFQYDLESLKKTDPDLILYEETNEPIQVDLEDAHIIAVGSNDTIYVGGKGVQAFDPKGKALPFNINVNAEVTAITVDKNGFIYLGVDDHIEIYDLSGNQKSEWESIDDKVYITSIAVSEDHVFVGDFMNYTVHHFDTAGNKKGTIGKFFLPSPYMDIAIADEERFWVANTGKHHLEQYTFNGDMQTYWGEFSNEVHGFCGCCNPVNFALLPNEMGFVTCEKGLTRVKIYDTEGNFVGVVAGPESFVEHDKKTHSPDYNVNRAGLDVAVDSQGRILIMDAALNEIRIFERKKKVANNES